MKSTPVSVPDPSSRTAPPRAPSEAMRDSSSLTRAALQAAWSKNAFETRVLDVGRLASFTDMFVILSGRSDRHVLAIADAVETDLKKQGLLPMCVEGRQGGTWVLLDYGSVVIHVF